MNKFTNGPWIAYGNVVEFDHRYQECCGNGSANGCCGEPVMAGDAGIICECDAPEDAASIAALPDLYNALSVLADACESMGIPVDAARAALAKASP